MCIFLNIVYLTENPANEIAKIHVQNQKRTIYSTYLVGRKHKIDDGILPSKIKNLTSP